ncbi:lipoyl(octanoyl) transferase LipB [Synechocystis sp. PCC 7338]|uniref:lipoyl(octanoyl) transferase LipB n=1 Tax=Synechocystis sp. PCC 7338 TaxID=2732530 RepID=UPI001BAE6878|nr:lipoyl(octanoyl) transferase LipB [Synechocystis sp. PCC 7338]QUS59681.1 lipoyl(octanoyl) transferase LipB [Synechocystis sp. PCC 7338]
MANPFCRLLSLGLVPYCQAWHYQRQWVRAKQGDRQREDGLMLLEHPPVYTLGTGSQTKYLKFDPEHPPAELWRTERGGEVTYHCPGQLVGYPIMDLNHFQKDLHWYLRQLEEVLIIALGKLDLPGERIPGLTGVWLEGHKVAAIAIKVSGWITCHGFALNICPDLTGFTQIVPCGIGDRPVGSLNQFLPGLTVDVVQPLVIQAFAEVFPVTWLTTGGVPPWLSDDVA